ncbi:MAG TPA: phenylalanine--tRNA ligase subunit alpha, partial [Candidatus Dormibacteraeota bacterium]|nr:phenylalanine--tRNA ligase subunit alpha [Candidatus Dormibacteraeota bacterium]
MIERVEAIAARAVAVLQEAMDEADLEAARVEYLGRKSELMALLSSVGTLPPEERGPAGKAANAAKVAIAEAIEERMARLAQARLGDLGDREWIDL